MMYIGLGTLPFIYLAVIYLTPYKFDMTLFIIICIFTVGMEIVEACKSIASRNK